jgi:TrmH family RNA methyltransferase
LIRPLGRHHPTIRRLRALRRDPARRRQESTLLAEGVHLARAALDSAVEVELVVIAPRLSATPEGRDLLRAIEQRRLDCAQVDAAVLDSLQDARSPQPILTLARRPEWPEDAGFSSGGPVPLIVVAAGIQDPGNLGGLVRTADAAGATACFVTAGSTDPFHPRAVRATMGAIFRLPVRAWPEGELLGRLRERGLCRIGAQPAEGVTYDRCDFARPVAVIFGGEGAGLSPPLRSGLDESVHVPMRRGVDSLSVGAAAAIILFEAARQRERDRP